MKTVPDDFEADSFAAELRRRRLAAKLSLQDLAVLTKYSRGYISKVENGRTHKPSRDFARICDNVLSANGELAALRPDSAATATDRPGEEGRSPDSTPTARLAGPSSLLTVPHDAADHRTNIEAFEKILDLMRSLGQNLGPSSILPILETHVQSLVQLAARSADAERRRETLQVAARFAEYAGWMAQESGDEQGALQWTQTAVEYAREAGDTDLLAHAFVRQALISLYREDAMSTVDYARRAQEMVCSPRVRQMAAWREAQGHALAGDKAAYEDAISRTAGENPESGGRKQTGSPLGPSRIPDPHALARGWSLYDLGDGEAAAEILGALWRSTPPESHRARARVGVRYALALVSGRQLEEAAAVLEPILRILPSIESATIESDVRLVARSLARWHSDPIVTRILPVLSAALSRGTRSQAAARTEMKRPA